MPINFQISTNHATEFPAFSIKYFQHSNPFDSELVIKWGWRCCYKFECEWPLEEMFGQWIKARGEEGGGGGEGELLLLSSCLYQPFLPTPPQHLMIHNIFKLEKPRAMHKECKSIFSHDSPALSIDSGKALQKNGQSWDYWGVGEVPTI